MAKTAIVVHEEIYKRLQKQLGVTIQLWQYMAMNVHKQSDNDSVFVKALQLAVGSAKVLFTKKLEDGSYELCQIGPINVKELHVQVEHNLPKFDWMDEASPSDPSKLFGLRTGPTTASINGKMLGLVVPNFDDNSGGKIMKDERKGGEA